LNEKKEKFFKFLSIFIGRTIFGNPDGTKTNRLKTNELKMEERKKRATAFFTQCRPSYPGYVIATPVFFARLRSPARNPIHALTSPRR